MAKLPLIINRIRSIIDHYEFGNVSSCARRIGMSQRGLAKIYHGHTLSPRFDVIHALCSKYPIEPNELVMGVTTDAWASSQDRVTREASAMAFRTLAQMLALLDGGDEADAADIAARLMTAPMAKSK